MSTPRYRCSNLSRQSASCLKSNSGWHICIFGGTWPAQRHYILNDSSLIHVSLQLYRHKSRNREFPHCSEGLANGHRRLAVTPWQACVRSCSSYAPVDKDTIWQANKTTWADKSKWKLMWANSAKSQQATTHSLIHLRFKWTHLFQKRGEYYLTTGVMCSIVIVHSGP